VTSTVPLTCMSILTLTIVMTKRRDIFKTIAAAAKRQGFAFGLEREGASHMNCCEVEEHLSGE